MHPHEKNSLRQTISHYLTGVIVLIKGYEKSEHFLDHPVVVVVLFMLGAFIIAATYFHHYLEKKVTEFKSLLLFTEFVVLTIVSYYYWQEGKKALPVAYFIAAIGYLIAGIIFYTRKIKSVQSVSASTESATSLP